MIIEIDFEKLDTGEIKVICEVIDKEDYRTESVFASTKDYPDSKDFTFARGATNKILSTQNSGDAAVAWANIQVEALKKHLNSWRAIETPQEYNTKI